MVARGPGAVGCAHCRKLGADVACAVCKHLVCDACAKDWATCDEPWGRVFRLGMTGRLIEVDPSGRFGLVSRWRGTLKLVDLRGLRWVPDVTLPSLHLGWREVNPKLTSDGRLILPVLQLRNDSPLFQGIAMTSLTDTVPRVTMAALGDVQARVILEDVPAPARGASVSAHGDRYSYVTDTECVAVISPLENTELPASASLVNFAPLARVPQVTTATYEPLPRKVVQVACVDASRDLLAAATWGEIVLHRMVGDRLERVGWVKTTGDVSWLAVAGPYLAARVPGAVKVWRLAADLSIGEVVVSVDRHVQVAALSRDGRYLAVGVDGSAIVVHDLDRGTVESFDGHTDDISLVRFVGDDHLLVTADDDNRVMIRPRTPTGYARAVMPVELREP